MSPIPPGSLIPHEAVSDVQTEETPNIVLTEETDHSKEVSNVQAEDIIHMESTQGDNEANEKPPQPRMNCKWGQA